MLLLEQMPMRKDNYSYALIKENSVVMIDPSEEHESEAYFARNPKYKLQAILNTHSHEDHIGGNAILHEIFNCPIYGPALESDRIKHLTNPLHDLDEITCLGLKITAHDVRAHTSGHMAYALNTPVREIIKHGHDRKAFRLANQKNSGVVFVGDSLFAAGCGRLFEGTPQNLLDCLEFYNNLDENLLMACAHEYTKANLEFAKAVFPSQKEIEKRAKEFDALLSREGSSLPCLFKLEHKTNPFLLALRPPWSTLLAERFAVKSDDLRAIVAHLRKAKDDF